MNKAIAPVTWPVWHCSPARLQINCHSAADVCRQCVARSRQHVWSPTYRLGDRPCPPQRALRAELPSFDELCDDADDELFNKAVRLSNHVLNSLLPPPSSASQRYNLRNQKEIYCNYLIIPHTCQTKTSSLTCYMKTHTRPRYSSLLLHCYM